MGTEKSLSKAEAESREKRCGYMRKNLALLEDRLTSRPPESANADEVMDYVRIQLALESKARFAAHEIGREITYVDSSVPNPKTTKEMAQKELEAIEKAQAWYAERGATFPDPQGWIPRTIERMRKKIAEATEE